MAAALVAAGSIAANAQVFSVNAVGYVNKTVPAKGLALVSNPLIAQTNTVAGLLTGQVPEGTVVFLWNTTTKKYDSVSYQGADFGWDGPSTTEVKPGGGMFIKNPGATDIKVTFVGEVPQGTPLTTQLVPGLQIVSSQVPQAGTPADLGLTANEGDKIYFWNTTTQKYDVAAYQGADFGWDPPLKTVDVGDAFFLSRTQAGTWTRNFTVSP